MLLITHEGLSLLRIILSISSGAYLEEYSGNVYSLNILQTQGANAFIRDIRKLMTNISYDNAAISPEVQSLPK